MKPENGPASSDEQLTDHTTSTRRQAMQFLGLGALGLGISGATNAETTVESEQASISEETLQTAPFPLSSITDQGPWYDHTVSTTNELKETPVPTASLEVVNPDGTETTVVVYRDGTEEHTYDSNAYITIEQSRDGGQSFSSVSTINNTNLDGSRTGNGLLALDDTTLYFFDSQVDYDTASNEATAVHRLDWDDANKTWTVTTNVNRFKNYRILPHYTENGLLKVGYVDFTVSPQKVRFAEFDPSTASLNTLGVINGNPIRPNEHVLQPRNDGTLVSIVRCDDPDVDTSGVAEQWSTSSDGGQTWTNHGYIRQTLHPSVDSYGATKGAQMIETPYGQRMVFLYRWKQNSTTGSETTVLGVFNPFSGVIEQNIVISTADSNEAANGSLRLVEDGPQGWRFYVVHEQGNLGSTGSGSGVFFRDLTVYQPANYLGQFANNTSSQPTPSPSVAANRENTFLSISQLGSAVGGRAHLSSQESVSLGSTTQVSVDTAEFANGVNFDATQNAFVVQSDGMYRISASLAYVDTISDALIQCRVHMPGKTANGYYTTAENVPVGIAGASVDTVEQLSQGDTIKLFTKYDQNP